MRSVVEYLERAAEFETLAAATPTDVLKKRYGDIAACYRLLAKDREWLIGTGVIDGGETIPMGELGTLSQQTAGR